MGTGQIITGVIFLVLSIGTFVISYFQFREKGFLFNNAYIWASPEERKKMDENKESKKTHYRQSGFVFMFIGIFSLIFAAYIFTDWVWLLVLFGLFIIITVVYAVVSSIQIERHK